MTHDERVKLTQNMESVLDAEIARARPSRVQALKAAVAAERAMVWLGLELSLVDQKLIETLKGHLKALQGIAEAHGAVLPDLPEQPLH